MARMANVRTRPSAPKVTAFAAQSAGIDEGDGAEPPNPTGVHPDHQVRETSATEPSGENSRIAGTPSEISVRDPISHTTARISASTAPVTALPSCHAVGRP